LKVLVNAFDFLASIKGFGWQDFWPSEKSLHQGQISG